MADRLKEMRNTPVCVSFNSEYATITPLDGYPDIEAGSLLQYLQKQRLLQYRYVYIHRNRLSVISILVGSTSIYTVVYQLSAVCLPHLTTLFIIIDNDSIPKPSAFSPLFKYNCFPCLKQIRILKLKKDSNNRKKEVSDVNKEELTTQSTSPSKTSNMNDQRVSQTNDVKSVSIVKDKEVSDADNKQDISVNEQHQLSGEPNVGKDQDVTPQSNKEQPVYPQLQSSQHAINEKGELQINKLQFDFKCDNSTVNYLDNNYSSTSYVYTCKNEDRLANLPGGSFKFRYNQIWYSFDTSSSNNAEQLKNDIIEVAVSYLID